jgi:hypothetical protein
MASFGCLFNLTAPAQEVVVRADDVIPAESRTDFLGRDAPVHFMNYRKPIVQESRAAQIENAHLMAERASKSNAFKDAPETTIENTHAFVENKNTGTFVKVVRQRMGDLEAQADGVEAHVDDRTPADVLRDVQDTNVMVQNTTSNLFLFIHGVLAGFAVLHLYLVVNRTSDLNFLSYYCGLAQTISLVYYVLQVVATISAFARFLLRFQNTKAWDARTFRSKLRLTCFFLVYLIGYLSYLVADTIDTKMGTLYNQNPFWYTLL